MGDFLFFEAHQRTPFSEFPAIRRPAPAVPFPSLISPNLAPAPTPALIFSGRDASYYRDYSPIVQFILILLLILLLPPCFSPFILFLILILLLPPCYSSFILFLLLLPILPFCFSLSILLANTIRPYLCEKNLLHAVINSECNTHVKPND